MNTCQTKAWISSSLVTHLHFLIYHRHNFRRSIKRTKTYSNNCFCQGHESSPYVTEIDYLFADENRRALLNWNKRIAIIEGIAHGLLYLRKHSRLRVIHRDLKPSNILLDDEMNPKISGFGTTTKERF